MNFDIDFSLSEIVIYFFKFKTTFSCISMGLMIHPFLVIILLAFTNFHFAHRSGFANK
jgi:hypothetical protein